MAVFRVDKTRDFTVMSNHHLKNRDLSLKAMGLLSKILSLPDDWDYTTRGLAAICKEGVGSIGAALKELETVGYIRRTQLRDAKGRITDTEYVIYEQPQGQPDTGYPDTENPYMDNQDTDFPCTDFDHQLNTKVLSPKKENTLSENTHSFFPSEAPAADRQTEVMRESIREQIEYKYIVTTGNRTQIDEFVEIMLEVMLTRSKTIKIGRDNEFPADFVRERFSKITSEHIQKVLDGISENTTRVWNTKAYLLAALFNAPSSIDNHYAMLVNHDLYGGE